MYHPDRVNYPRKRIGGKGEGKWQTIPWEQAFDEIAAKLTELKEQHGPETLVFNNGTGRTMFEYALRFANLFGTPNQTGPGQICHGPIVILAQTMCGWALRHRTGIAIEQGEGAAPPTKCVMLAGINPAHSTLRLWNSLRQCAGAGIKVIVIDPRRTEAAQLADIWLQLRPGTDYALLLGLYTGKNRRDNLGAGGQNRRRRPDVCHERSRFVPPRHGYGAPPGCIERHPGQDYPVGNLRQYRRQRRRGPVRPQPGLDQAARILPGGDALRGSKKEADSSGPL
jgi:hypothetical protein